MTLESLQAQMLAYTLLLPRFISCFVMLPVLSKQMLGGAMIRNGVVCSLALYAYPTVADTLPDQLDGMALAMLIAKEVLLGLLIGFVAAIPFWAIEASGFLIDNQRGAAMGSLFNPSLGSQTSPTGLLLTQTLITLFFASGAFLALLAALFQSYISWPVAHFFPTIDEQWVNFFYGPVQPYVAALRFAGGAALDRHVSGRIRVGADQPLRPLPQRLCAGDANKKRRRQPAAGHLHQADDGSRL